MGCSSRLIQAPEQRQAGLQHLKLSAGAEYPGIYKVPIIVMLLTILVILIIITVILRFDMEV